MMLTGFIEQHHYRLDDLSNRIGCDTIQAKDILNRLIWAGVAKICQEPISDDTVDESLHGHNISGTLGNNTRFQFCYVGVVEVEGFIVKCYPKYIVSRTPNSSDLRLVLNAIERYNYDHTSLTALRESSDVGISTRLALALRLLRDYLTYGLYSNQREEQTFHGQGEIDWETTINTTMPLIRDNNPYYFDYYTNDTKQNETDYITRLHSCIITECSKLLHSCDLDEILLLETPMPYHGDQSDFGDNDYICQRLKMELNVQFVTRKQSLLHDLLLWIQNTKQENQESEIYLFGTSSFHALWEIMCADVFVSQYKHTLQSLGIKLKDSFTDSNKTLEELMPKPRWTSYSFGSSSPDEKATLRPDYMRIVSKNGKNFFVILDAKYYNIEFCAGKVKNNPGVEDVCKQHLYQIAYKRFIETHSLVPVNAFVSPLDAEGVKVIGEAEMPALTGLNNEGICPIKVVMLSANELLQHYINRQHVDLADIIALFPGA